MEIFIKILVKDRYKVHRASEVISKTIRLAKIGGIEASIRVGVSDYEGASVGILCNLKEGAEEKVKAIEDKVREEVSKLNQAGISCELKVLKKA